MMRGLRPERRVAVLGAGLLGCSAALFLARKGARVTLFDAAPQPMERASRWNEGKIHLGYVYAGDRSLSTVRKLLPGATAFIPLVQELIGCSIEDHATRDDLFLIHPDSVVSGDDTKRHLDAVWEMVSELRSGDPRPEQLSAAELSDLVAGPDIVAGFRVSERSVNTNWLADRIAERVGSEERIQGQFNLSVESVFRENGDYHVTAGGSRFGGFDAVVNALWEGRGAIDATMGYSAPPLSYRYRVAVFATAPGTELPNAIITTGPFGDVKNYDGRHIFLSWYPSGLRLDHHGPYAPPLPAIDAAIEAEIHGSTIESLKAYLPTIADIRDRIQQWTVRGGWIVANGEGLISDPNSTLHRRDQFGIVRDNGYYSVDTGKYCTAPWLGLQIAEEIVS